MIYVRPAVVADASDIEQFQIKMASETEDGLQLDPPTVRAGVAAVFADSAKGRYWVAEADEQADAASKGVRKVVGALLTVPEWSDWRNGTVLWIHSVYVRPEYRRQGVYRALYSHLKGIVQRDASLHGLRLYVHNANQRAQRTYEQLGMDGAHYRLFQWMKNG